MNWIEVNGTSLRYELTGSSFLCTGHASQVALASAELVR